MTDKLPTMKQIHKWVNKHEHSYRRAPAGYGPFLYNLQYWGAGHVRVVSKSLASFKRICGALMDADGYKWRKQTTKGDDDEQSTTDCITHTGFHNGVRE